MRKLKSFIKYFPLLLVAALTIALTLGGCASDFTGSLLDTSGVLSESTESLNTNSVRVKLHHADFYSLTSPNSYGCAGDGKKFYETYTGTAELPTPNAFSSVLDGETIKPSFIKNIPEGNPPSRNMISPFLYSLSVLLAVSFSRSIIVL